LRVRGEQEWVRTMLHNGSNIKSMENLQPKEQMQKIKQEREGTIHPLLFLNIYFIHSIENHKSNICRYLIYIPIG
jgi:hypothetical protein